MQHIKPRLKPLLSKAIIAALSAGLISGSGIAQEPIPNTYTDVSVPQMTGWNDANIVTLDGLTGATEKSHIYRSADAIINDPGSSVAAVFWELDNDSGRAPGIQVVTDDFDVPTNNCIMASGEIESTEFPGTIVPKTCSDDEGSSKRYFLELTSSDVPIDLAFDLGVKDIRYKGVKDPSIDGGEELAEFRQTYGIGRIYRVIQKVINNTDKRIASYKFELGTGIDDAFQPLTFEEHSVAFEMRSLVPREFFEGETGAPDISVWNPQRFATISPKMYDDGARARFEPGFLDHAAAGFLLPQVPVAGAEKSRVIDSGTSIIDGIIGSMTANYFNIADTQGVVLPGNMLGYHLPDALIPEVIGEYSTNEIGGESDAIVAIWDGTNWRSGRAGLDGDPATVVDNYGIIPDAQLVQWAAKPLGLDLPTDDPTDPDFARYEVILSDDLSGLNTDMYIYIGDKLLDEDGDLVLDSITLRLTANSVETVIGDVAGSEAPPWGSDLDNSRIDAPTLASYMPVTGTPIAFNDITTMVQDIVALTPVTIDVLENDLLDGVPVIPANGFITITTGPADGNVTITGGPGDEKIEYTPALDFVGTDFISYTYTRTDGAGEVSNIATIKIVVDAAPIPDQPTANNDSATMFLDTELTLDVLTNDKLNNDTPTTVVVSINNDALNGVASVTPDNTVVYTPDIGFVGFERFTYVLTVDGIVSNSALITVRVDEPVVVVPDTPVANNDSATMIQDTERTIAVLANDELNNDAPGTVLVSIDGDALNGVTTVTADNTIVYTPAAGFVGTEQITYVVTVDGLVSNIALVTISVDEFVAVIPKKSSSSSSGCSVGGADTPFDPILPGMMLLASAGLFMRRRKYGM
jgi:hypothetical protein